MNHRIVTWRNVSRLFVVVVGMCSLLVPVRSWAEAPAEQVTEAAIARALHISLNAASGENLRVLRGSFVPGAAGQLRVLGTSGLPGSPSGFIRMDCGPEHQCLPFFVSVRSMPLAVVALTRTSAPTALGSGKGRQSNAVPVERAGDRVDVVEDVSGMHLQAKGICLQSGSVGDLVRVQNLSSHRVLTARIAARNRVEVER